MGLKIWVSETRPRFMILSVVLAFLGNSIAWYDGAFRPGLAAPALVGLLLVHISVNTINDYFDYKSGVDLKTKRTPFSGGSGILPAGLLKPEQVLGLSMASFLLASAIGIYFIITRGWLLLPLLIMGATCALLYTPFIARMRWPEWAAGLGMGSLPILGTYFVQTTAYALPAVVASIPSGILVHNLLLLNEFPDVEADKTAGRRTLPIIIGRERAGLVYSALTVSVYLWIAGGVMTRMMPFFSLLALLTLPLAIKAIRGTRNPDDMGQLMPAMANNILVVMLTQLLLGIGYLLAGAF